MKEKKIKEIGISIQLITALLYKTRKKAGIWGWIRFLIFAAGTISLFLSFYASDSEWAIITAAVFIPLFVAASIIQARLLNTAARQNKWIEIKKSHIARASLDWENIPASKLLNGNSASPLEADLDITGNRSLHQLIDYSKTLEGSSLLREYFTARPAEPEIIIKKQNIIKELQNLSHFREKYLLESALSSGKTINTAQLKEWLIKSDKSKEIKQALLYLFPLCIINIISVFLSVTILSFALWGVTAMLYTSAYFLSMGRIRGTANGAEEVKENLSKIIGMISYIENYNFKGHKNLTELASPLKDKNAGPTKELNRINGYISWLSLRGNPLFWIAFIILFPFDYYLAYKIEMLKKGVSGNIDKWIKTWNEFEAYVSLAEFSILNPEYCFPQIIKNDENGISINAVRIGHPLINAGQKVCNDYSIDGTGNISLITGSNMSGKSTFLRTLGINMCLAYAGAPVNADKFSISITRLFTCIKVSDSVIDGISYFYAEVKRLKALLDETASENKIPVFFLIDEIFKGTNNIERLKGSSALIKNLAGKNGAGLITTHDLDLIKLSDSIKSISNYHFKEEIKESRMLFDYKLSFGPCPTTNALVIMKMNGLPVE